MVPAEDAGQPESRREVCDVGLRPGCSRDLEGSLRALRSLVEPSLLRLDVREPAGDPRRRQSIAELLELCDSLPEQPLGGGVVAGVFGVPPRAGEEVGAFARVVGEVGRLREVQLCLACRPEGVRPLARAHERSARLRPHGIRVLGVREGRVGVEVVRGEDLGDLVLLAIGVLEVRGRREVPRAALVAGERLVGDVTDEILEEAVLAVLG